MQTIMVCHGSQSFDTSTANVVSSFIDTEKSVEQGKLVRVSAQRNLVESPVAGANSVMVGDRQVHTHRRTLKAAAAVNGALVNGLWEYNWGGIENGKFLYLHARVGHYKATSEVDARILVWVHDQAPRWQISMHCHPHPKAKSSLIRVFDGRGWVLKIGDTKKLHLPIDPKWFMDFELPTTETVFEFNEKSSGAGMPDVNIAVGTHGKTVIVPRVTRRRQIRPRKRGGLT